MIEKQNGQRFGTEITISIFWILASSRWYFWTKMGRKSRVDFWKLDRDVSFDLTYQVLQLRMEINRSEAIGSFSESSPNFDAGAGVSEPRFCGFDQEGDFWSKNKYHQSIRNWILRIERSSDLQILYFDFLDFAWILHHSSNDFWTNIRFKNQNWVLKTYQKHSFWSYLSSQATTSMIRSFWSDWELPGSTTNLL